MKPLLIKILIWLIEQYEEEVADFIHQLWSDWMKYLFEQSKQNKNGTITIPKDKVERWKRQVATHYDALSIEEQLSDLLQVDKLIAFLRTIK